MNKYNMVDIENNTCIKADSYKMNHWNQYPKGTQYVHAYYESRVGAQYPETTFFGLQAILMKHFVGQVVTKAYLDQASDLMGIHFGNAKYFNKKGWEHILHRHDGKLPLIIRAVPEGLSIPTSNLLMTVENTDPECFWLTNWAETVLSEVWYPSTVATIGHSAKELFRRYLSLTSDGGSPLFMLHDFGFRGVSSVESAGLGGMAHLVHFRGTDTIPGMAAAIKYYGANPETLAFSVAATEHSIMTALGKDGEADVVANLLAEYPTGILSVVGDSYDIYRFVSGLMGIKFKEQILARDGVFVVRPDSITPTHHTPAQQVVWIAESLWQNFGGTTNLKGFKVINPKVRILWGDGIQLDGVADILEALMQAGFSAENIATFGMGGGLLQKLNRDTQRFAFKSSAQCRNGIWHDVWKEPKDISKASKRGKLQLIRDGSSFRTIPQDNKHTDILQDVFRNGELVRVLNFDEVRATAE